jgi:Na+-driven multidrug efflux pump
MVLLAIVAAVFLLGAWGMLMAGVVTGINELGVPIWITLLALGVTHLLCAWLLIRLTLKLSVHLELPATRRQLRGEAAPDGDGHVA